MVLEGNHSDAIINTTNSSNGTVPTDDFDHKWSFEFSVIIATILSISAFFTIVGNSMVLMVIIRHRGMRTRTNLFLVNLAVADLLVGIFVVPFSITTLIENQWVFGEGFMCLLNGFMNSFCLITSFHTLMYISIHKYFSIVRPLSNPLTLNYIIAMMAAAWIWAGVCSTMNIVGLTVEYKPGTSQCGPRYPHNVVTYLIHGVLQVTVIVLPAVTLVFCYVRMFVAIKKHSKRLRNNAAVEEDFILSQQKKVAMTLFIVLATFVMMALPYHIYATYTTIEKDKQHFSGYLNPLAYMFLYLSSMCNPIIYAFRSPAFREGYKEILCQTPNYVISDDSEQVPRGRRLSSFITNLRRVSTLSSTRRESVPESDLTRAIISEPNSPNSPYDTGDKPGKPKKQKSLFTLLRSTRQSNAQSVVHRNGDVIIMKGGKIVSVRRGGEGRETSPFLDRLERLRETSQQDKGLTAGLAGTGHVMFGLVCEGVVEDVEDDVFNNGEGEDSAAHPPPEAETDLSEDKTVPVRAGEETFRVLENGRTHLYQNGNTGNSETLFHEKSVCDDSDQGFHEPKDSVLIKSCDVDEQSKFVATGINSNNIQRGVDSKVNEFSDKQVDEIKDSRAKYGQNLPPLKTSPDSDLDSCGAEGPVSPVGVVINVSEDDEILSVMPLTPHTREHLAKSDMNLSQPDTKTDSLPLKDLSDQSSYAHSSENVTKRPPAIRRLPSMEFLDPPVHLFRSRSNVSMHSSSPSSRPKRTHTVEVKSGSTSPNLRPFFSRRKEQSENIADV